MSSIVDIIAKVENNRQENARKLAQAHGVMTKNGSSRSHKDLKLFKKCEVVAQTDEQGDEEGVSQDIRGVLNNDHCVSIDNLKQHSHCG